MCGILGWFRREDAVDRDVFTAALETLRARGPDQEGVWIDGNRALGHKRLSILDLSTSGRQPMGNEDGSIQIVFNGEIYNYRDVQADLKGDHAWRSKTDTEVLIHGYEEWGDRLVDRIEGMFAFAIYDRRKERLLFARDHFGKKPLYYFAGQETLAFASELKALLAIPEVRQQLRLDHLSVQKYLIYGYVPSPQSIFEGVRKLEPSSLMTFDLREWKIVDQRCFWRLEDVSLEQGRGEQELLRETEERLEQAVVKRLHADVPVGVFLSGGVDSSLITSFVHRHAPSVEAFTVVYRSSPEADESEFAKMAAEHAGIRCNQCNFEDSDVEKCFVEILDYLDEPMADAAIIPLHFVSKFTRQSVTVVLSGDGGDEVFGGYGKYRAQLWLERLRWAGLLLRAARGLFAADGAYRKLAACAGLPFAARQFIFGSGGPVPEDARRLMPAGRFATGEVFREAADYTGRFAQRDVLNRSLFLDCRIQLPDWYLVKGDRATMATSLEMRNPLLDKALAEYAFGIPGEWKVRSGETKYLLKRLAVRHTDRRCVYRPKRGFGVPLDRWIRNDLRDLFSEYLPRSPAFIDSDCVGRLHREHLEGKRDWRFHLLRVFNLNYFLESYGKGVAGA